MADSKPNDIGRVQDSPKGATPPSREAAPNKVASEAHATSASETPSKSAHQPDVKTAPETVARHAPTNRRPRRQYLVAARPSSGIPAQVIEDSLRAMDEVEIIRRLKPRGFKGLGTQAPEIIVARLDEGRARSLGFSAPMEVVIEEDSHLICAPPILAPPSMSQARAAPQPVRRRELRFRVAGADGQPLPDAAVTLFGRDFFAVQGLTDKKGETVISVLDAEADLEDMAAVYVRPVADHWEAFIPRPALDASEPNVVTLDRLGETAAKAPWGLAAMGLPQASLTGAGVKIAIIASGCDNGHPALNHRVTRGVDLTHGGGGWMHDELGVGTHMTGVLAAKDRGVAPGAEITVFKVAPGGRCSDLVEALDQCIERQVDIICLGVTSDRASDLVARKLGEARTKGAATIAAAGDDGGPVRFPAQVPGVVAVAAVGRAGEFPGGTRHGDVAVPGFGGGLFAAAFSGAGPQISLAGPGVAVVSTAPGGGFAARDGTAIAAAHVAGYAALVLAHHPLFRQALTMRGEQRVEALIELIRASAIAPLMDPIRVGAGLPDISRTPGLPLAGVEGRPRRPAAAEGMPEFSPAYLAGAGSAVAMIHLRAAGLI